jgi:hypothetical protein
MNFDLAEVVEVCLLIRPHRRDVTSCFRAFVAVSKTGERKTKIIMTT